MTSRAYGITLAAVGGTPLLAAALVIVCPSTTAAVIACLALAAGGMIGLWVGAGLCASAGRDLAAQPHDAEVDALARRDRS